MPMLTYSSLFAAQSEALTQLGLWLHEGGVFLWLILLCGGVGLFVSLVRGFWMRRAQLMPARLVHELEALENDSQAQSRLQQMVLSVPQSSPLGKVLVVAFQRAASDLPDLEGAVEARARREVSAMNWGLPVLEVVITIAPLLGLLGTAAGLVDVFGGIAGESKDVSRIAIGVGKALSTTIAGLAVAVPCVITHTMYTSAIERCAVDMEVMMHRLVSHLVTSPNRTLPPNS